MQTAKFSVWVPGSADPAKHPAVLSSSMAQHELMEEMPASTPEYVLVVCCNKSDVHAARTLHAEGSAKVLVWSWLLPEREAMLLENDGIGVVYGMHTAAHIDEACHITTSSKTTELLATAEKACGLDQAVM